MLLYAVQFPELKQKGFRMIFAAANDGEAQANLYHPEVRETLIQDMKKLLGDKWEPVDFEGAKIQLAEIPEGRFAMIQIGELTEKGEVPAADKVSTL